MALRSACWSWAGANAERWALAGGWALGWALVCGLALALVLIAQCGAAFSYSALQPAGMAAARREVMLGRHLQQSSSRPKI
jgi:hypothetical protein